MPVEPAYRHIVRVEMAMLLVPVAIAAAVADLLAVKTIGGPAGLLTLVTWLGVAYAITALPPRRFARLGYQLAPDQLRVARGWLMRIDTIVPFVRVQHIDVTQRPVDRLFGLSRLEVHTSGTHNSVVTLPGLTPADAEAMREVIRRHIQTDFA